MCGKDISKANKMKQMGNSVGVYKYERTKQERNKKTGEDEYD